MKQVKVSKQQVEKASKDAVLLVEELNGEYIGFVIEREPDGGIIHPQATEKHKCYPICMAREPEDRLESGDWVVIPYVKNNPEGPSLYGQDGINLKINWVD